MGTLGLWSFRALTTHRAPSDWPTPSSYSAQPRYHSNDFFFEQVISRIFTQNEKRELNSKTRRRVIQESNCKMRGKQDLKAKMSRKEKFLSS